MTKLSEADELLLEETPSFQREARRKELEAKVSKVTKEETKDEKGN